MEIFILEFLFIFAGLYTPCQTAVNFEPNRNPEMDSQYWRSEAQNVLRHRLASKLNTNVAKNVIFFLGDGMSIPTLAVARLYMGKGSTKEKHLSFEEFPFSGLSKTYCVDSQVADSACSATAYLGGVKANRGTIGVTAAVGRKDCILMTNSSHHVTSIAQWAQKAGKLTGVVTTTRVTHASPAGVYAHTPERKWEHDVRINFSGQSSEGDCVDIAQQLIFGTPGKYLNVVMGGGRRSFYPKEEIDHTGVRGLRLDGKNLIKEWKNDKINNNLTFAYTTSRSELMGLNATYDYLLGLFAPNHMAYHLEAPPSQPSLSEMTFQAIRQLQRSPEGFFLFVEGGKIDMAHHDNLAKKALDEVVELSKAVATAVNLTDEEDTLIVVTSDHAHVMTFSGYAKRWSNILGIAGTADDKLPYSSISYANGPGFVKPDEMGNRQDLRRMNMESNSFKFPSMVPLANETHGGDDVAVFARGPWAHLFSGTFEQNFIAHAIGFASCLGDGLTACAYTSSRVQQQLPLALSRP